VAEALAGIRKLYYDEKVSVITVGGASGAEFNAVAPGCEELGILFVAIAGVENLANYRFTVNATVQAEVNRAVAINFIENVLKPRTVAALGADEAQTHSNISAVTEQLKAAGIKTVYIDYFPLDATDFSPYLTKIKYEKPDLLYAFINSNEPYISIAKQIMELGGWGDIKVFTSPGGASAKNMVGAQGWYMFGTWAPGLDYPGAEKFLNDYRAMHGRDPSATQVYYYNSLWTAIYAIELAGTDTDRVAIAEAARSGKLEWDTPMGQAHFQPDGTSGLSLIIQQIVNKEVVLASMQ
jgi:branched-chain amino acid transport system substrate-binding protein